MNIHILRIAALTGLAACSSGGGGGGGADGNPTPEPPNLFIGSTDSSTSGNGADFASSAGGASDLDGKTYKVLIVRTVGDVANDRITQEISEGTMIRIDAQNYDLIADGETLSFVNGLETANGDQIQGFARPNLPADHAAVYRLLSGRVVSGGGNSDSHQSYFVVGLETSPETIETITGSATYTGQIEAVGPDPNRVSFARRATGDVTLVADFGANAVSGTIDLTAGDTSLSEGFDATLALAPTAISGNGFAGDLTITDCSGVTCTSDSQIGGAFFGPNANEIAGITQLDLSSTDAEGNTSAFTGSGGFTTAVVE